MLKSDFVAVVMAYGLVLAGIASYVAILARKERVLSLELERLKVLVQGRRDGGA